MPIYLIGRIKKTNCVYNLDCRSQQATMQLLENASLFGLHSKEAKPSTVTKYDTAWPMLYGS